MKGVKKMGKTNNQIEVEILETFGESVVFVPRDVAFVCGLSIGKTAWLLKKLNEQGYLEKVYFSNALRSKIGMEYGYKVKRG